MDQNPIARLLSPTCVLHALAADSTRQAFESIARTIEAAHGIAPDVICDALLAREKLGSTGLGLGVAIPHGRIRGLRHAVGAFAHLAPPIDFDAPDGRPVDLMFVLLVPEKANETHLQLLSTLAQMFTDRAFRESVAAAQDAAAAQALFAAWSG